MLVLIRRPLGPGGRRRGVTLVEMLVVVALVVLMMTILVQIFQAATGAMSASRTIQELDVTLRQVDSIIRSDLAGATACMDPSVGHNDPDDQRGYFEYGENAFADAQGEDTDDYLAFTTRAPEGQSFSGRQWLSPPASNTVQPATVNSQVAEVIYFLRNGNLYRRVFLVAPERASSIYVPAIATSAGNFYTSIFGGYTYVSWQGMNDISCRPGGFIGPGVLAQRPTANTLGDLTNRENRAFRPRFINDFYSGATGNAVSDGIPDDNNGDYLPDYYPTLYTDGVGGHGNGSAPNVFVQDLSGPPHRQNSASYNIFAFPFTYPGMYSVPDTNRLAVASNLGWIHGIYPASVTTNGSTSLVLNHGPLDIGDNLPAPTGQQTWWGFPTWRETMTGRRPAAGNITASVGWTDPITFVTNNQQGNGYSQPYGLIPYAPNGGLPSAVNAANLLPPVTPVTTGNPTPFDADPSAGSSTFIAIPSNPTRVWEDDLLLTGVRSFDVKAYDANAPLYNTNQNGLFSAGYYDLGYGSTYFYQTGNASNGNNSYNYLGGPDGVGAATQTAIPGIASTTLTAVPWQAVGGEPVGFGHEGRIPSLTSDFRLHPRRKTIVDNNGNIHPYNIGDDAAGVIRLARVWDSWSTDYTNAPDTDLFGNGYNLQSLAVYPSFPAPYPSALRGIQIQIRLVDARGEKAKPITIRVDFTDKLE